MDNGPLKQHRCNAMDTLAWLLFSTWLGSALMIMALSIGYGDQWDRTAKSIGLNKALFFFFICITPIVNICFMSYWLRKALKK